MRLNQLKSCVEFTEQYPIFTCRYPNWENLNPHLEKAIRQSGDKQNYATNVRAYMTNWQMWLDDEPGADYFKEICTFACNTAVQESPVQDWKPTVTNCWGAIYKKGEFTQTHNHWPAIWSFTYYVKTSPDCAPIMFPGAKKQVVPYDGMFCLFPGWVDHHVPPSESDTDRVMVAGNIAQLT